MAAGEVSVVMDVSCEGCETSRPLSIPRGSAQMRMAALFSQGRTARPLCCRRASHLPDRSDHRQADIHIAASGVGIGADMMRLRDQRFGIRALKARQRNRKVDVE